MKKGSDILCSFISLLIVPGECLYGFPGILINMDFVQQRQTYYE